MIWFKFRPIRLTFAGFVKIWQFLQGLFSIWQHFESTLTNFACYWANVHGCKLGKILKKSNHLARRNPGTYLSSQRCHHGEVDVEGIGMEDSGPQAEDGKWGPAQDLNDKAGAGELWGRIQFNFYWLFFLVIPDLFLFRLIDGFLNVRRNSSFNRFEQQISVANFMINVLRS